MRDSLFARSLSRAAAFGVLPLGANTQRPPDVDQVVGQHSHANPSLHSFHPAIQASAQSMPPLQDTDPALTSGAPSLRFLEPPALLLVLALLAGGVAIRHRYPLHAHLLDCSFVRLRVVAGV